ncbi:hypothetical protein N9V88_02595 [bacterium]|nr:hypothetical protein [bacterium]MDC0265711.1 hypothetical protein [Mariniblastus sp.]
MNDEFKIDTGQNVKRKSNRKVVTTSNAVNNPEFVVQEKRSRQAESRKRQLADLVAIVIFAALFVVAAVALQSYLAMCAVLAVFLGVRKIYTWVVLIFCSEQEYRSNATTHVFIMNLVGFLLAAGVFLCITLDQWVFTMGP